ncbi:hypothetical protein BV372_12180 [Nostoc sp. T09]|nr:hypothetical protein BV372_12180 [Nostoc sp. T09]
MEKIAVTAVAEVVQEKLLVNALLGAYLLSWVALHINQVRKQSISEFRSVEQSQIAPVSENQVGSV